MTRLATAEVVELGGDLASAIGTASLSRKSLLVRLTDDDGFIGLGEACPLDGHPPREELERVLSTLERETLPSTVSRIASVCATTSDGSARFALECALLDLAARRQRISLAELLADGSLVGDLQVSKLVGTLDDPSLDARISVAIGEGFSVLKVKGRGDLAEADRVRTLRERFGAALRLRLDLNGAFEEPIAARAYLERVGPIEACEDPVCPSRMLDADSPSWPCDVLLDAGLENPIFAELALSSSRIVGIVLKPQVLGLLRALDLAKKAKLCGKDVVVTHALEGPVGLAAARELALATGARRRPHGLARHDALSLFPATALPREAHGAAFVCASSGSVGLGVELP